MKADYAEIPGYGGMYVITRTGEVVSFYGGRAGPRYLKPFPNRSGYPCVHLAAGGAYKSRFVHRLVACAFIDNPLSKLQVNHKDGNKRNNAVENLEWSTATENRRHAIRTGLWDARGERGGKAKLRNCDIPVIRALRSQGSTHLAIARRMGVSEATISRVTRGVSWGHAA